MHKERYIGPYLRNIGRDRFDYNPKLFRNFVIRKSLEVFFQGHPVLAGKEIEVVFDRFLTSEEDEAGLKSYLRGNYQLPPFLHIVQVDSMYSDAVQAVDVFGTLVKNCVFDASLSADSCGFASIFEIENPDQVKRKSPDTH